MNIYLGKEGLDKTWQKDFPETILCHKCRMPARIMFVAFEGTGETKYVSELHKNKKGKYWPHDAIACAVYLCENCFEANALINQA